jgi:hypothetical protein
MASLYTRLSIMKIMLHPSPAIWASLTRSFHSSQLTMMPRRQSSVPKTAEPLTLADALAGINLEYAEDDTTSVGHLMLRRQRQLLYYLRLIEHEMPKLVGKFSIQ